METVLPASTSTPDTKAALREQAKALRRDACARLGAVAAISVVTRIQAILPPPPLCVTAYWPMRDELDVRPLIQNLLTRGYAVGLPVVAGKGRPLEFRRFRWGDSLVPAALGTSEPGADQPVVQPDVVIAPLLAFDRAGHRLGYGGGYYDRTLRALRAERPVIAIGVGFAAQEMAGLPHDGHDARLDWIVTENATIEVRP
jgi:5-formyltetrahydrofolate cyclo-ligase